MIAYLIGLLLTGIVVGGLARLALPGRDPMSIPQTILIGIAGSFIAGLVMALIAGGATGWGFPASVLVATGLVYLVRRSRGGDLGRPATGRPLHR